jgi:hypothetical protein
MAEEMGSADHVKQHLVVICACNVFLVMLSVMSVVYQRTVRVCG